MRILLTLILLSASASADDLIHLENGEVADADDLNHNFQLNNNLGQSAEAKVTDIEAQLEGNDCSSSDLNGTWMSNYASGNDYRTTLYWFSNGSLSYTVEGRQAGSMLLLTGNGTYSFNESGCYINFDISISDPAEEISGTLFLSKTKLSLHGTACSTVSLCEVGLVHKLRVDL